MGSCPVRVQKLQSHGLACGRTPRSNYRTKDSFGRRRCAANRTYRSLPLVVGALCLAGLRQPRFSPRCRCDAFGACSVGVPRPSLLGKSHRQRTVVGGDAVNGRPRSRHAWNPRVGRQPPSG